MLFIVSGPVASISVDTQPTSATVSWTEPQYIPAHYPIVTYEVGYYSTNDRSCNGTITNDDVMPEGLRNVTLLTATFNGLMSNTCYGFVVRGYTEVGPGPWKGMLEWTMEAPTTPPTSSVLGQTPSTTRSRSASQQTPTSSIGSTAPSSAGNTSCTIAL